MTGSGLPSRPASAFDWHLNRPAVRPLNKQYISERPVIGQTMQPVGDSSGLSPRLTGQGIAVVQSVPSGIRSGQG